VDVDDGVRRRSHVDEEMVTVIVTAVLKGEEVSMLIAGAGLSEGISY
jgi:hypothetical protein